jgi:hypothetical protein
MSTFLGKPLAVVNLGLESFAASIEASGGAVTRTDWSPPAGGDADAARALALLSGHPAVEEANRKAYAAYERAEPVLEGIGVAGETIPGLQGRMLLHAGPPIEFARMCGPMRGAVLGAMLLEGWADDLDAARSLAERGVVRFAPCHHHDAVGPMAGIISPSMPVYVVRNAAGANLSYSNLNEGLGKVLRFGANGPEVIERLRWMRDALAPALAAALRLHGPLALKPLIARALHMGDEAHNRNVAGTSLLIRELAPALVRTGLASGQVAATLQFMHGNDHFFINLGMAALKCMMDAAHGVPGSSMVTAMSRNGVEFGLRLSGTGDAWFTAPAPVPEGLFFPGYSQADAGADMGDSAITETAGVGGFAMAAAPAIVQFVGGTPAQALENTRAMMAITLGRNAAFTLPALDFTGTPAGIDARKVADTGVLPVINTGIAHREAGVGQVGAGTTHAPMGCFAGALVALARSLEVRSARTGAGSARSRPSRKSSRTAPRSR